MASAHITCFFYNFLLITTVPDFCYNQVSLEYRTNRYGSLTLYQVGTIAKHWNQVYQANTTASKKGLKGSHVWNQQMTNSHFYEHY